MNAVPELAPDEPLSPELVLVLPPELRARVLACLPVPVWPEPRRVVQPPASTTAEPFGRSLGRMLVARVAQLAAIFLVVTLLTLALALVAHAMR